MASTAKVSVTALSLIQLIFVYEWWQAGYEKILSGTFPSGLTATFEKFASANPHAWYKTFLLGMAMDKSVVLGYVVEYGELVVAVLLLASLFTSLFVVSHRWVVAGRVCAVIGLLIGMELNANFYFAAGWMSPSTAGLNAMMFWIQAVLLYVTVSALKNKEKA